jgi:hypothetical protein
MPRCQNEQAHFFLSPSIPSFERTHNKTVQIVQVAKIVEVAKLPAPQRSANNKEKALKAFKA